MTRAQAPRQREPESCRQRSGAAQFAELAVLGELVDRCRARGVQAMVEGPGHIPFNQIQMNMARGETSAGTGSSRLRSTPNAHGRAGSRPVRRRTGSTATTAARCAARSSAPCAPRVAFGSCRKTRNLDRVRHTLDGRFSSTVCSRSGGRREVHRLRGKPSAPARRMSRLCLRGTLSWIVKVNVHTLGAFARAIHRQFAF